MEAISRQLEIVSTNGQQLDDLLQLAIKEKDFERTKREEAE